MDVSLIDIDVSAAAVSVGELLLSDDEQEEDFRLSAEEKAELDDLTLSAETDELQSLFGDLLFGSFAASRHSDVRSSELTMFLTETPGASGIALAAEQLDVSELLGVSSDAESFTLQQQRTERRELAFSRRAILESNKVPSCSLTGLMFIVPPCIP